jgi:GT2 family glycosyltransferase
VSDSPTVSVIVVNLNGRGLLGDCLDSLAAQDYPADRVEIIMVDNHSADDSVTYVREAYPGVRIIEAPYNLGFAGGNNLGARAATGEYLALINNDAQADSHWLRAMVEALEHDPVNTCVASKILDADGHTVDFVGTGMNLYGRAFQIDAGLSVAPGYYDKPQALLAPCGGAMMIPRELFWKVGGFDQDFVAYFEDVDLGWRLWIHGYRVIFVPGAIVYHKQHQTGSSVPVEQRYALSETNALRMLIKNCDEQNLAQVLPFSLFMGVKRSLEQAGLDRQEYKFGYPLSGDAQAGAVEPEPRMTRVATSFLVAIDQVADELPRLLEKRRAIQALRVRSDEEIFGRFPMQTDNPIFPWKRYQVAQDQLAASLGIPDALKPQHGSRLLIITDETIGLKMKDPAIRAWEMACALSEQFEVMLAAPGEPSRQYPGLRVVGYEADDPGHAGLEPYLTNADVVLVTGRSFARIPRLQNLGRPTIMDLSEPFDLQDWARSLVTEEQRLADIDVQQRAHLQLEGLMGDLFICSGERQRDFWLGMLLACGRVNRVTYDQDPTLRALIDVVPFGLPSTPPYKTRAALKGVHPGITPDDKLLLWNCELGPPLDPLTLVDALAQVVTVRADVRLFLAVGRNSDLDTEGSVLAYEETLRRCRELGLLDRYVFLGDQIPYDDRGNYLMEADLAISIRRPGLESRFASDRCLVDCIWAGLPAIGTAGDPLSETMVKYGLARTVPARRSDLLATTIVEMLADEARDRVDEEVQTLRDKLCWIRNVEPIANFMKRVTFAPDALDATRRAVQVRQTVQYIEELRKHVGELQKQHEERARCWEEEKASLQDHIGKLEAHIEAINRGRVMRLLNVLSQRK